MADIGTVTGTLELNVAKFDQAAAGAETQLKALDTSLTAVGEAASVASSKLTALPGTLDATAKSAQAAATGEAQLAKDLATANQWFDQQVAKVDRLNSAMQQQAQGVYQTTVGVGKAATAAATAAKAESDYGFALGYTAKAGREAADTSEMVSDRLAHVGAHALGANRQLASLAKLLPTSAVGALAVVGGIEAGSMVLEKAIESADEWATEGIKARQEWTETSRTFASTAQQSVLEVSQFRARAAHDQRAEIEAGSALEIAKAEEVRDARVRAAEHAHEVEAASFSNMLPSIKEVAGAAAIMVNDITAAVSGGLATTVSEYGAVTPRLIEQHTKMLNEIAQADMDAARRRVAQQEKDHLALEALDRERAENATALANEATHAEAAAASARLAANKDVMDKLRADQTEALRLIDERAAAQTRAAKIQFGGATPEDAAQREQAITDIQRAAAAARDQIATESAEKQKQALRSITAASADIFREMGAGFEQVTKKLDLSGAIDQTTDKVQILREAYKAGKIDQSQFADGVDALGTSLHAQGASWTEVANAVDQESAGILKANAATKDSVAEIDGVYTNLTGATKTYADSIERVVSGSDQVTQAFQSQATQQELVSQAYATTATSMRQMIEGAQQLAPALDRMASSQSTMGESLASTRSEIASTVIQVQALADAYDRAAKSAKDLEDVQTTHSLDTSMQTVGVAAQNVTQDIANYKKYLDDMIASIQQFGTVAASAAESATTAWASQGPASDAFRGAGGGPVGSGANISLGSYDLPGVLAMLEEAGRRGMNPTAVPLGGAGFSVNLLAMLGQLVAQQRAQEATTARLNAWADRLVHPGGAAAGMGTTNITVNMGAATGDAGSDGRTIARTIAQTARTEAARGTI
jgi:hypothetical protein